MKYLSLKEFVDFGYLQEVNRLLLHRLGLSLVIEIDESTKEYRIIGISDSRDDPEGCIYTKEVTNRSIFNEKIFRIEEELKKRDAIRLDSLGFSIQPPILPNK